MSQRISIEITQVPHGSHANIQGRVWPYTTQMGLILVSKARVEVPMMVWDRGVLQDLVKGLRSQMAGWAAQQELPWV